MTIKDALLFEKNRLDEITSNTKSSLNDKPIGYLRISNKHGCVQYYHCADHLPVHGKYIRKKDVDFARQLAQKSYNEKILKYSEKAARQISALLRTFDDDKIDRIYEAENAERKKLITPVTPTYTQQLETWVSTPYTGKEFSEEAPVITTNSGLRVRSKSEKILADYFDSIGLQYKYECPLQLKYYGIVYPDFTFLSRKTGKEIYWEHEGMLDNPSYAQSAVKKIEVYEKNGIFPGENLILTFESSCTVLNSEVMKSLAERYLL